MNKIFTIILILIVTAGGAFIIFSQSKEQSAPETTTPVAMERIADDGSQTKKVAGNTGELLAGSITPYLVFNKADYDKAKSEGKIIFLNFYANWCPICRAEEPDVRAAFDSLQNPNVVGFQVNFKDDQTDADEKNLAQEFTVPYQHTKVILRDGKEVLKETAQWNKEQFIEAITNATN